ncbi:MAG: calcium-binding protein [Sphingomonadaceae bacterium]
MATFTYTNSTGITISDLTTSSQTLSVYGTHGTITALEFGIGGLSHTFPDDLDMLLVAPNGSNNLVFWSDAGGGADVSAVDLVISDGNAAVPDAAPITAGTYGPGAYVGNDGAEDDATFGSATGGVNFAATDGSSTFASEFNGLAANGTWTYYLRDDAGGDTGSLGSWSLTVSTSSNAAELVGIGVADTITVSTTASGTGAWNFNGNIVEFTGVTDGFTIDGGLGADTITGGQDDDTIRGGPGADILDGGGGNNTLDYSTSGAGVTVDIEFNTASGGDAAGDMISNFDNVIGSNLGDVLFGSAVANNILIGRLGADDLAGFGGTNMLDGGGGEDYLIVQSDLPEIGSTLDGGGGTDSLVIIGPTATNDLRDDTLIQLERLEFQNLSTVNPTVQFNAAQFAFVEVQGQSDVGDVDTVEIFMDTETVFDLSGVAVSNFTGDDSIRIFGDADIETITGSSANDVIEGGGGGDTLDGGGGNNTVSYASSPGGVVVALYAGLVLYSDASGDTLVNFQNVIGSAFDDALEAHALGVPTTLIGGAGNDQLSGLGGTNVLRGEAGNDTIYFDLSQSEVMSELNGGADDDTLHADGDGTEDFRDDTLISLESLQFDSWDQFSNSSLFKFNAAQFQFADVVFGDLVGSPPATPITQTVEIFMDTQTVIDLSAVNVSDPAGVGRFVIHGDGDVEIITGSVIGDTIQGGAGNDFIIGFGGTNAIYGEADNDTIVVDTGLTETNSTFDGGADFDELLLTGGNGAADFTDDTIVAIEKLRFSGTPGLKTAIFNANQFIFTQVEGDIHEQYIEIHMGALTTVNFSNVTVSGIEHLSIYGDGDAETIFGTQGDDAIIGYGGNDRLDGGLGMDDMYGGIGDDVYVVAQVGDTVNEAAGAGFDTVYAYVDFALDADTEVLVLRGTATMGTGGAGFNRIYGSPVGDILEGMGDADVLYGGGGADGLYGGSGNDRLDGGPGNDLMFGGADNDIYIVAQVGDVVTEHMGEGTDTIYSYVDYTAPANVENLILRGSATTATGNAEANSLAGTSGSNTLTGLAGNDRLFGKSGNDTLSGGDNNDRLYGDRGQDTMTGGTGLDQFFFRETLDSSNQVAFADRITDFTQAEFDRIVLTDIDADETNGAGTNEAFSFIGTGAFSAPGQVRYEQVGGDTHVFGNTDADLFPEFAIVLTGTITLTSADFFL